jgi:hypothetical protein
MAPDNLKHLHKPPARPSCLLPTLIDQARYSSPCRKEVKDGGPFEKLTILGTILSPNTESRFQIKLEQSSLRLCNFEDSCAVFGKVPEVSP